MSIGLFLLKAKQDTFPNYLIRSGGNGTTFLPGYEIYNNYYSIPIGFNFEYKFLDSKVSPIVGIDLYAHFFGYEYISFIEHVEESYSQEALFSIGYLPRIGLNWDMTEDFTFDMGIGRSASIEQGFAAQTYWKTYFLFTYYLSN